MKRLTLLTTAALALWFGGRQSGKQAAINELRDEASAHAEAIDDAAPKAVVKEDDAMKMSAADSSGQLASPPGNTNESIVTPVSANVSDASVSASVMAEPIIVETPATGSQGSVRPVSAESASEMPEQASDLAATIAEPDEDIIDGPVENSTSDSQLSWHLRDLKNRLSSDRK